MKNKIIELITEHADKHGINNYVELISKIQNMEFPVTMQEVKEYCENNLPCWPLNDKCRYIDSKTGNCKLCDLPNEWNIEEITKAVRHEH
jgi:hypothetical protein